MKSPAHSASTEEKTGGRLAGSILLLVVLGAIAFSPALVAGFLNWDDNFMVVDNPHLQQPTRATIEWAFTTFTMGHYQPLSWMSLVLDRLVWGFRPFGFHLSNLLLHLLNGLLVFALLREVMELTFPEQGAAGRIARSFDGPILFATLLWLVHPMRVESVVWITERRDVLSGFFLFGSTLTYLRWRRTSAGSWSRSFWVAVLLYAASLLSKASGVVFPALLVVLELSFYARGDRARPRRVVLALVPFSALAAVAAALAPRAQAVSSAMVPMSELGVAERLLVACHGWVYYLCRFFWPQDLSPLYEMPIDLVATEPRFLLACGVVLVSLVGLGVYVARRGFEAVPVVAAFAFYTLLLLPVLGFLQSGPQLVADRYSYLPSVILSLVLAALLIRFGSKPTIATRLLLSVLVAALVVSTFSYSASWRTTTELWQAAVESQPECALCHEGLAVEQFLAGDLDAAEPHLRLALAERPNLPRATYVLARVLDGRGQLDEARELYERAALLTPGNREIEERLEELSR